MIEVNKINKKLTINWLKIYKSYSNMKKNTDLKGVY